MIKKYFTLLCLLVVCFNTKSQTAQWVEQFHHSYSNYGKTICSDLHGNIYVLGEYHNDYNHTLPVFGTIIRKYDSDGNLLWGKTWDNVISYGLALSPNGKLYVTGNYLSGALIDNIVPAYTNGSAYYAIIDTTGIVNAVTSFSNANSYSYGINFDTLGNFYLTGVFKDTLSFNGKNLYNTNSSYWMYIAKFNSAGNCKWAKQSVGYVRIKSFLGENDGTTYIAGDFTGNLALDGISITAKGSSSGFATKVDSSGNCNWLENFGTYGPAGGQEAITSLAVDKFRNVIVTGWYDMDITIGNFYLPSYNTFFPKNFVAIYDSSGVCTSAKVTNYRIEIFNDIIYKIGSVNTAGNYEGLNLNPGFYVMRCDTTGNGLWAYQPSGNIGATIHVDSNHNLYLTGGLSGTVDFGGINITGYNDLFIAKIKENYVTTGIKNEIKQKSNLYVYPNPTQGILEINYQCQTNESQHLNIFDSTGKAIYSDLFSGSYYKKIELSACAKGIYFIVIVADGQRIVKKIVLE